jgi:aspartyl-tRNA(Asn)/glutamyl-tRNA(Gln) amidotransferase subunit A
VPTYNEYWGGFGAWPSLAQAGPMTRSVDDAALMLDVLAGPEAGDPFALPAPKESFRPQPRERLGLRVAWSPTMGWATVDPEVRAIAEAAARRFAELGCEVEEAAPALEYGTVVGAFAVLASASDAAAYGELLDSRPDDLCDYTRDFMQIGRSVTGEQYVKAERLRVQVWQAMDGFLSRYDLLLTPAVATPPFPIGEPPAVIDGEQLRPFAWTPFTTAANLSGQPAASLPCGWTKDGLPVGLQVMARAFRERTILEAALAFERAQPWAERRPPEPGGRAAAEAS